MAKISPPNPPETVFCLVEIPKGGSNKYEYDYELKQQLLLDIKRGIAIHLYGLYLFLCVRPPRTTLFDRFIS